MANTRLLVTNLSDSATITQTTGSTATGYPLTNMQNAKRGLVWRSTQSTGNQVIVSTFTAQTIKAVALVNYLAHTSGGTIKAEYKNGGGAYAAFGGGTGLFTLPASNRTRLVVLFDTTGVTATDVKITFTNTNTQNVYVELGRLYVGSYSEPTLSIAPGVSFEEVDPSVQRLTLGGQTRTWVKQKFLEWTMQWPAIARSTDLATIQQAFDSVGRGTPMILAVDPADQDFIMYGLCTRLRVTHVSRTTNRWRVDFGFAEEP